MKGRKSAVNFLGGQDESDIYDQKRLTYLLNWIVGRVSRLSPGYYVVTLKSSLQLN